MSRNSTHVSDPLAQENTNQSSQSATSLASAAKMTQKAPLKNLIQQLHWNGKRDQLHVLRAISFTAAEAIWQNRLSSFLTILGISIGVAAVIAALTLTQGVKTYLDNVINQLGASTILVFPGTTSNRGANGAGSVTTLTQRDATDILKISHVTNDTPFLVMNSTQIVYSNQNWNTNVYAVNEQLQQMVNWQFDAGSGFNAIDEEQKRSVAVIGNTTAHNLFATSGVDPIGKTILIGDQSFRVLGVLAIGGSGFGSDDIIYVPFSTALVRLENINWIDQIQLEVDSRLYISQVENNITSVLKQNHHIRPGTQNDFQVLDFLNFIQRAQQVTAIMTLLLVGIAVISLTVGGIGIMNIMLVAVTERTREIGLCRSIGARKGDIRNQFLIESLLLCLIGSAVGLIFGLLAGYAVVGVTKLPFVITPTTIALPIIVSVVITVIFGLYPAVQASNLDPVEALRAGE